MFLDVDGLGINAKTHLQVAGKLYSPLKGLYAYDRLFTLL